MTSLEGQKVVTAEEMARIEKLSGDQRTFMENAGLAIANYIEEFVDRSCHITLFVGKGNNGGDAFAAGVRLLERGYDVSAVHFYPKEECSPLCKLQRERFKGKITSNISKIETGIILDGLVGTGFHGKAEGVLFDAIELANNSALPIVAIDIPSGLNGTTGVVESIAIKATKTLYLGLPKLGLVKGEGWNHVGELIYADFGLPQTSVDKAKASAYFINEEAIVLPPIVRTQHKYQRGYVLGIAGSATMSGAAILSAFATLRAGSGIVRLFHFDDLDSNAHPEIIHEKIDKKERIFEEAKRAKSAFIGPGLGRDKKSKELIKSVLAKLRIPCVIDADALFFLPRKIPSISVLTPHHKEMERLGDDVQKFVDKKEVTLVMKGAPTYIYRPKALPLIIPRGDPGMATAGSGDVLTGIIAAFLTHFSDPFIATALAVYVHALAGEAAACKKTSYCVVASDIIEALPDVFAHLA